MARRAPIRATVKWFNTEKGFGFIQPADGGKDVFVLQSTCQPTNDTLMEVMVMVDALKRASAGRITAALADRALKMLDVDPLGFDVMDRKLLEAVIHRFDGGPVGLDNIAASIGEERDTIEDVIEPYLIQQGFLQRTPRGRTATLAAYRHLGVSPPRTEGGLFTPDA